MTCHLKGRGVHLCGDHCQTLTQKEAERIAEFLGMERYAKGQGTYWLPATKTTQARIIIFGEWLQSDSGTVAMIFGLKAADKFQTMAEALLEDDINSALIEAIKEVLK